MKNKFKKGLFFGSLLTIAAAIGISVGKEEKALSEEMKTELSNLSKQLQKKLKEMDSITKESFNKLVTVVVDDYAEKKSLTKDVKDILLAELHKKWDEVEKDAKKKVKAKK